MTTPLLNKGNKGKYIFIDYLPFWKISALFGRDRKLRFRIMYYLLSLFSPAYIIDINWINRLNYLYLIWCRQHRPSKFVVIQHGLYVGGIITDNSHKYAKCDTILCWGEHSEKEFLRYNKGEKLQIIRYGNPVFNLYNRKKLEFPKRIGNSVLVAPTVLYGERKMLFEKLIGKLTNFGFDVYLKEHRSQATLSSTISAPKKIQGDFYEILLNHKYDIIISDTSTSLIDALCFKNPTLYFSPPGEFTEFSNNAYSMFMVNIADHMDKLESKKDLLNFINLQKQEELFNYIHTSGDNLLFNKIL